MGTFFIGKIAALNQALADRNKPKDVIYHSDCGVQYLSIRDKDEMTDCGIIACGIIACVGTTGDSYDNALAETANGLYKSEMIEYLKEQWHGVNDVELVILEWVALRAQLWSCKARSIMNRFLTLLRFNKARLHSAIGYVSPFKFEKRYYDNLTLSGIAA